MTKHADNGNRRRNGDHQRLESVAEHVYIKLATRAVVLAVPFALTFIMYVGSRSMDDIREARDASRSANQSIKEVERDVLGHRAWTRNIQVEQNKQRTDIEVLKTKVN